MSYDNKNNKEWKMPKKTDNRIGVMQGGLHTHPREQRYGNLWSHIDFSPREGVRGDGQRQLKMHSRPVRLLIWYKRLDMGILLFILGALLGTIGTYWYAKQKIDELTERSHDKSLVISLLKTRADESTRKVINKRTSKKTKATKQRLRIE